MEADCWLGTLIRCVADVHRGWTLFEARDAPPNALGAPPFRSASHRQKLFACGMLSVRLWDTGASPLPREQTKVAGMKQRMLPHLRIDRPVHRRRPVGPSIHLRTVRRILSRAPFPRLAACGIGLPCTEQTVGPAQTVGRSGSGTHGIMMMLTPPCCLFTRG